MQLKTTLSLREFRDNFAHKTSPEWAIGSQVTPEGLFPSGKSDRKSFTVRISKHNVNPLTPTAIGTIKETDTGCELSWKLRRSPAGYGILLAAVIFAAVLLYAFGPLSLAAAVTAVHQPSLWVSAVTLVLFALMLVALAVWAVVLIFWIPKRSRDRLADHIHRVVGKENIVE